MAAHKTLSPPPPALLDLIRSTLKVTWAWYSPERMEEAYDAIPVSRCLCLVMLGIRRLNALPIYFFWPRTVGWVWRIRLGSTKKDLTPWQTSMLEVQAKNP